MTMLGHNGGVSFDHNRAATFVPRADEPKTAVLVDVADESSITSIHAPFGAQQMRGSFYIVAEGSQSYGADRTQFEATHRQVGPVLWIKTTPVQAYQAVVEQSVVTSLGDHQETAVVATPGDWLVRQEPGEVYVVSNQAFHERYEPEQ